MTNPADAFVRLLEVLDRMEIPYLVGGSMASSVRGITRPTLDADIGVDLKPSQVDEFVSLLKADFLRRQARCPRRPRPADDPSI